MDYLKIEGLGKTSSEDLIRFIEHRRGAARYWKTEYSRQPTAGAHSLWKMEEKLADAFQAELNMRLDQDGIVEDFMNYLDSILPNSKNKKDE